VLLVTVNSLSGWSASQQNLAMTRAVGVASRVICRLIARPDTLRSVGSASQKEIEADRR
jgi:hypothetical protein